MAKTKATSGSETSEQDEGKVYFIGTDQGLFPLSVLKQFEKDRPTSKQLKQRMAWLDQAGLIPHPFDVSGLLFLMDNSSYFDACCRQISQDVVGQGWELKAREGVEKPNEEERTRIKSFLMDPNETDEDISDIIEKSIVDWGSIGWWGMEVAREQEKIEAIWHVPAHTLWIYKEKDRFCQKRNDKKVWFVAFGSDLHISASTGKDVKGRKNLANELIYNKRYYQQSDFYGIPPIYPAVGAVTGLLGIRDYNLAFFENYGVPAALVTLKGRWSTEAARQITYFMDVEIKGTANAHKTLVLKPPANGEAEFKPLVAKVEEGGFKLYMKILRDEVLSVYKMPASRIGIMEVGQLGGSPAGELTKIYAGSIIAPLKRVTGRIITNKIIRDGLGSEEFYFEWNQLDTRDLDALVKRLQILFMMAAISPNEIRREMGKEPRKDPEADQYYIAANFLPAGEDAVEKREAIMTASLEELAAKVGQLMEDSKAQKVLESIRQEE